jgi:DNA-binding transcriptional regulator YiaG
MQTTTQKRDAHRRKAAPVQPRKLALRPGSAKSNLAFFLRESLDLSAETLGRVLQVSSRTIARWEERETSPRDQSQILRIHKLQEIVDLGSQIYTPAGLREFLSKPQPVFNGHTAYQLMSIGEYDVVLSALAADFEGSGC